LWLDPTARPVPFGDLPESDREAPALPLSEEGDELVTVPAASAEDNVEEQRVDLIVGEDGHARGDFRVLARGAPGAHLREWLLRELPVRRHETMERWLALRDAHVTQVQHIDGLELAPEVAVVGALETSRVFLSGGASRVLRLSSLAPSWLPAIDASGRETPIVFTSRVRKKATVRLELPPGLTPLALPAPSVSQSRWLDYRLQVTREADAISVERELTLKERIIAASDAPAFAKAVEAIADAENAAVIFGTKR
jgi:hypothetical protein